MISVFPKKELHEYIRNALHNKLALNTALNAYVPVHKKKNLDWHIYVWDIIEVDGSICDTVKLMLAENWISDRILVGTGTQTTAAHPKLKRASYWTCIQTISSNSDRPSTVLALEN